MEVLEKLEKFNKTKKGLRVLWVGLVRYVWVILDGVMKVKGGWGFSCFVRCFGIVLLVCVQAIA